MDMEFKRRFIDKWKTHFYNVEGWDEESGYPKRQTLEDLDMKNVADVLQEREKLGSA